VTKSATGRFGGGRCRSPATGRIECVGRYRGTFPPDVEHTATREPAHCGGRLGLTRSS
jgi:hypothetical protein